MITFVAGTAQFVGASNPTIATPTTLNVAAGDTIVVGIRCGNGAAVSAVISVTDTAGNVYRFAGRARTTAPVPYEVWDCTNCAAHATNTVTATFDSSQANAAINAVQFRGLATVSPLDVNVWTFTSAANIVSPTFSTAVANAVIIALSEIESVSSTWTPDTGYSVGARDVGDVTFTQYKIVSALQTGVTVTANNNQATTKCLVVISLHAEIAASGSGGSGPAATARLGETWQ